MGYIGILTLTKGCTSKYPMSSRCRSSSSWPFSFGALPDLAMAKGHILSRRSPWGRLVDPLGKLWEEWDCDDDDDDDDIYIYITINSKIYSTFKKNKKKKKKEKKKKKKLVKIV